MPRRRKKTRHSRKLFFPGIQDESHQASGEFPVYQCFNYTADTCEEHTDLHEISPLEELMNKEGNLWINLHGLNNTGLIKSMGQLLDLDRLLLADLLQANQRPFLEDRGDQLFFSFKMVLLRPESHTFEIDQISFVLKNGLLLSLQEKPGHVFDEIRDRLRQGKGQVRHRNTDYLLFLMLNAVLQTYQSALDYYAEMLDSLEEDASAQFGAVELTKVQDLRKDLIYLRKSIFPMREIIAKITSGSFALFDSSTARYFNGLQNQVLDISESIMMYRDIGNYIMEQQIAFQGMRLNDIIRILTVISTVFIPLTFIVGIYGMNFEWMPELGFWWAYPAVMTIMLLIALFMLYFFKRRRWI